MNRVINGKRYDTETAECVGSWDNGQQCGDFGWYCERLFKKRTGEFFLNREGGASTRMARPCGSNSWIGGEDVEPISYEEAAKWAEEHLTGDEYAEVFGEPDEGTSPLYLKSISAAAKAKLDREASRTGKTQARIVEELLEAL